LKEEIEGKGQTLKRWFKGKAVSWRKELHKHKRRTQHQLQAFLTSSQKHTKKKKFKRNSTTFIKKEKGVKT